MSRKFHLIALAVVAAAVAAPIAQSADDGTLLYRADQKHAAAKISGPIRVDPLAVSILQSYGWSADRIQSWTQGACSDQVKGDACSVTPEHAQVATQVLAQSMHSLGPNPRPQCPCNVGLPGVPSQLWADQKAAAAPISENSPVENQVSAASPAPISENSPVENRLTPASPVVVPATGNGFAWGDAGIGAGFIAALGAFVAGGALVLRRSRLVQQLHP